MREGGGRDESADATEEEDGSELDESDSTDAGVDEIDAEPPEEDPGEAGDDSGSESTGDDDDSGDDEAVPSPEANVPQTPSLELEEADNPSLEAEDDVRAPLPDSDELEEALESARAEGETADDSAVDAATPAGMLDDEEGQEEETRVLEFELDDEYYCLDIDYIEEIVKEETITRVPNTPEFVEGVVDLRGQITTILNPKVTIEKDDVTPGGLIIVFDSASFEDQGHVGWVVDDVRQVSPITDSEVNDPPGEESYINGVIDREDDDQFVIWTSPDMAMEEAE